MKVIPLSRGMFAKVDDADYERIMNLGKWVSAKRGNKFYAIRSSPKMGRGILMHRVILPDLLPGFDVDRVDGDGLNNQRNNLRIATRSQNNVNSCISIRNTSGRKGVWWCRDGMNWRAAVTVNHRTISLGRFDSLQDASEAYDNGLQKFFGPFAKTNEMNLASLTERKNET